jgi:hypothetical protein
MSSPKHSGQTRRLFTNFLALVLACALVLYGFVFYEILKPRSDARNDPLVASRLYQLLVCTNGAYSLPGLPYACKLALTQLSFDKAEVEQINTLGAIGILSQGSKELAEIVLPRLLKMGADIDAVQVGIQPPGQQWTALHHAVYFHPWWAELLLEYKADQQKKDASGRTPLDLARELLAQRPENPEWVAIAKLLEQYAQNP